MILISDIDENKSKTFQIKRCPLIFIIPPFNDDEIWLLYHIDYNDPDEKTKLFDHYKNIGKIFNNYPGYIIDNSKYSCKDAINKFIKQYNNINENNNTLKNILKNYIIESYSAKDELLDYDGKRIQFLSKEIEKYARNKICLLDDISDMELIYSCLSKFEFNGSLYERIVAYIFKEIHILDICDILEIDEI